jgi:tetratricopeptide (TPR) repeat protein
VPLWMRVANAVLSYGRYVKMLVWPTDLALLYPLVPPPAGLVLLAGVVVAALTAIAWRARRSMPFVLVGWLWFLGTLVPVIGIVQVGVQALADRYTYVPSIGFFIAVVWGTEALARRAGIGPTALRVAGGAVVAGYAVLAHAQIATWATPETLWRQAVTAVPDSPRAHIELGVVYGRTGRPAEAAAQFEQVLPLPIATSEAQDLFPNLAQALLDQGKTAEAIPYLERSRQLSPERADVCHKLALAYLAAGRADDALAAWRDAIRLNPDFDDAYLTMGVVLAANGRVDEARRAFTEVLRINPSRKDAQDALALLGRGR